MGIMILRIESSDGGAQKIEHRPWVIRKEWGQSEEFSLEFSRGKQNRTQILGSTDGTTKEKQIPKQKT